MNEIKNTKNTKKLPSSKVFGAASNAMGVIQNIASLGSNISALNTPVSSENMTGQEMANVEAQKESGVASSAISTIMAVIGTVLACI